MIGLPENWKDMTELEKDKFFCKYYLKYTREGETNGLQEWTPQDIKDAYEEYLKEKKNAE